MSGHLFIVSAPSGAGKTTLVRLLLEKDPGIGCIVLAGSEKAFAAGADIKEMAELDFPNIYFDDFFSLADRIAQRRKPLLAAVSGYALGGGCELALMCDYIVASRAAVFSLPELRRGGHLPFRHFGHRRLRQPLGIADAPHAGAREDFVFRHCHSLLQNGSIWPIYIFYKITRSPCQRQDRITSFHSTINPFLSHLRKG